MVAGMCLAGIDDAFDLGVREQAVIDDASGSRSRSDGFAGATAAIAADCTKRRRVGLYNGRHIATGLDNHLYVAIGWTAGDVRVGAGYPSGACLSVGIVAPKEARADPKSTSQSILPVKYPGQSWLSLLASAMD